MKIAITGSTGFIGRWFINLYASDYDILALGRSQNFLNPPRNEINYISTDYSYESLINVLSGCNSLIHLSSARIGNNATGLDDYIDNVKVSYNVFNACSKLNIKNIIYASSILVYGNYNSNFVHESEEAFPDTIHGLSKLMCEQVASFFNNNYGLNIKSLRIAQVFGTGDKDTRLINNYIINALNKKSLLVFGDGSLPRNYIYVKDVCDAISKALNKPDAKGIYNIASNNIMNVKQIAEFISETIIGKLDIKYTVGKGEFLPAKIYSITKANEEFNWFPKWSFADSTNEMIRIYKHENTIQ